MSYGTVKLYHPCHAVPTCRRRIPSNEWCCGQHRAILGWSLAVEVTTAWRERSWCYPRFAEVRDRALAALKQLNDRRQPC
jgi:hypothetical protein